MQTIEYGLKKYGAVMTLTEVLAELKLSENTLRRGITTGVYPEPVSRGRFSTEAVMRAIATDMETSDEDPFVLGPVPEGA